MNSLAASIKNFKIDIKEKTDNHYVSCVATGTFKGKRFYIPYTLSTEFMTDPGTVIEDILYSMALDQVTEMYNSEFESVDYHYCPSCGFRMTDAEFMTIIVEIECPGRGRMGCGTKMSRFHTKYVEGDD